MRRLSRIAVVFGVWLALAACAAQTDNGSNDNRHTGFYGGIIGGGHP